MDDNTVDPVVNPQGDIGDTTGVAPASEGEAKKPEGENLGEVSGQEETPAEDAPLT